MSFKLHTHHYSDTPLPRFFFRAQCARGESARARSDQQKDEFLGAKRTPPEGWFHEPRSEAESALRKRNHAPAGCTHMHMHTLTHVRAGECAHMRTQNVRAGECAHSMCTYAPEGCMKSTHPKGAEKKKHAPEGCHDRSKARSRKT